MSIGICHLVRAANGREPFEQFIDSFRRGLPTGDDWRLVLIFKGFTGGTEAYLEQVRDLPVETVDISDRGFDIAAYFRAAQRLMHDELIFFNSFAQLIEPRWFDLFTTHFRKAGIGLVGTTGSWESVTRNHLIYSRNATSLSQVGIKLALAAGLAPLFPPFPNPHVRTNGFMIRRDVFLATKKFPVTSRFGSLFYESGWLSLTRQVRARGLEALLVDRHGQAFTPERWNEMQGFRSDGQEDVIVRDNRTREFEDAAPDRKALLQRLTWGDDYARRS